MSQILVLGELLTTIESISNVLAALRRKGEGRIFVKSTPESAAFLVEISPK